jgi:hypothetical protein
MNLTYPNKTNQPKEVVKANKSNTPEKNHLASRQLKSVGNVNSFF